MNPTPLIVAERYGVILGAGTTRAAAAAAAARVSRVETRFATAREYGLWLDCRLGHALKRLGIDSERALLIAIRTDIERVLWAADCADKGIEADIAEPEFPEYRVIDAETLDPDAYDALVKHREAIDDELREVAFRERQLDIFAAAVPA